MTASSQSVRVSASPRLCFATTKSFLPEIQCLHAWPGQRVVLLFYVEVSEPSTSAGFMSLTNCGYFRDANRILPRGILLTRSALDGLASAAPIPTDLKPNPGEDHLAAQLRYSWILNVRQEIHSPHHGSSSRNRHHHEEKKRRN